MTLPSGYESKVYAGVLGKIIGVYLGRPFEGWTNERIEAELGEIRGYVAEKLGNPLIVTDDDISGTFTFFRALEDYGYPENLTSYQIGETWLNYIIENRTILWWGGMGMSSEHTAYLRLKSGIPAPESGSTQLNGKTVAEQIGAQIFIEGWGLVSPGNPERAAQFAAEAGRVSHDGESVFAAQIVAAMVALAFEKSKVDELLAGALLQIPEDCLIARVIGDVRSWHRTGMTWRECFGEVKAKYGYDKFGGVCHVVPNHALVILALIYGQGDFSESQMIVNTCGWDTDCNAANVGCILGVLNGLSALEGAVDWRGPVADRMYLPTADGGRCITDAVRETYEIVRAYCSLNSIGFDPPKHGAKFHFLLPGSVQGFSGKVENHSGMLVLSEPGTYVTPTFTPVDALNMPGYSMMASPTLYPGQTVSASVEGSRYRLVIGIYNGENLIDYLESETFEGIAEWVVPNTGGFPVASVGVCTDSPARLDWLTWTGTPTCDFVKVGGSTWRSSWVNGVSDFGSWPSAFFAIQNEGTGLISTGTRDWQDYEVSSELTVALCERAGVAVRVQGMRRFYGLLLCRDGYLRLIRVLDGEVVLAAVEYPWEFDQTHRFWLRASGHQLIGGLGDIVLRAEDNALTGGGIALVVTEGRIGTEKISVRP